MPVRCPNQPLKNHEFHKVCAIFQGFTGAQQKGHDCRNTRPAVRFIFHRRRDAKGLTQILLRQTQQHPSLLRPAPVKAGHRQRADPRRGDNLCLRHRQAQFPGQRQAQKLVIHAFTQIQRRIRLLYLADGQFNDMRGRRGALRNTPVPAHPQQRRFLLGAGHRDTEIILAGNHPERDIRLVGGQQSGELRLVQRLPAQPLKVRLFPRR